MLLLQRFAFDVAVLTLNQPVGDKLGWFGIANDDCQSIRKVAPLSNWGYPGVWLLRCPDWNGAVDVQPHATQRQLAPALAVRTRAGDRPRGTQWGMRGCSVTSVDSTAASTCGNAGERLRKACARQAVRTGARRAARLWWRSTCDSRTCRRWSSVPQCLHTPGRIPHRHLPARLRHLQRPERLAYLR